jgi:hypothetical protein
MAEEKKRVILSGAPDNRAVTANALPPATEAAPKAIWNEKNQIVDEGAAANMAASHYFITGKVQTSANVVTPYVKQMQVDFTAEPTTAPMPSTDKNFMPMSLNPVANDSMRREAAIIAKSDELVNRTIELENPTEPVLEDGDESGNVRGNPLGAEGGNLPQIVDLKDHQSSLDVPIEEVVTGEIKADEDDKDDSDAPVGGDATLKNVLTGDEDQSPVSVVGAGGIPQTQTDTPPTEPATVEEAQAGEEEAVSTKKTNGKKDKPE